MEEKTSKIKKKQDHRAPICSYNKTDDMREVPVALKTEKLIITSPVGAPHAIFLFE